MSFEEETIIPDFHPTPNALGTDQSILWIPTYDSETATSELSSSAIRDRSFHEEEYEISEPHLSAQEQSIPGTVDEAMQGVVRRPVAWNAITIASVAVSDIMVPSLRDPYPIGWKALSFGWQALSLFSNLLKWPIGTYILWLIANLLLSLSVQGSGHSTMSSIGALCHLPIIVARWKLWPCDTNSFSPTSAFEFLRLAQAEGDTLQTLLEGSVEIADVSWDLWQSDMAVGDLVRHLRQSNLDSKEALLRSFSELQLQIQESMELLRELRTSTIKSVRRAITVNEYSLQSLELLSPTWTSTLFPVLEVHAAIIFHQNFDYSVEVLVNGTTQILAHCKIAMDSLETMAVTLSTIHDITSHKNIQLLSEDTELQKAWWTLLGGNQNRLQGLEHHIALLGSIANYRARALKRVRQTMDGVLSIQKDVYHIRNNVASADHGMPFVNTAHMKQHLYDIKAAMVRIDEGLEDTRRRDRRLGRSALLQ